MPHFIRTKPVPAVKGGYRSFRPYVRADFLERCAYCLINELYAGRARCFELDHFKPKSRPEFAHLINDFYNLYYSCRACNGNKHDNWPPPSYQARGIGFVDLCKDNFSDHFKELPSGEWQPLTPSATYTEQLLVLNDPNLIKLRVTLLNHGLRTVPAP